MDLIVNACRALANVDRLRLLRVVYRSPGLTIQEVAAKLGLSKFATSRHVKLLAEYHLVQASPSGRYVSLSPPVPRSTSNRFLSALQALTRDIMGGALDRTVAQLCDSAGGGIRTWDDAYRAMVREFTAYTHLRRLLVVRHLEKSGGAATADLKSALGMSADAAARHLAKLRRRGIALPPAAPEGLWTLRRDGSKMRRRLRGAVLNELAGGKRETTSRS